MKFEPLEPLTPFTPAPGQDDAPVCIDGVCEVPSNTDAPADSDTQADE